MLENDLFANVNVLLKFIIPLLFGNSSADGEEHLILLFVL